jgi:hypothetical protein
MAPTNVELYEALKPTIGEDAARMIAEVVPPARDAATKDDVAAVRLNVEALRTEFAEFRGEMREEFANVRGEMHAERVSMFKWLFAFMIPVWGGSIGTALAVVLKG